MYVFPWAFFHVYYVLIWCVLFGKFDNIGYFDLKCDVYFCTEAPGTIKLNVKEKGIGRPWLFIRTKTE